MADLRSIENILSQILSALGGSNGYGIPNSALMPGRSVGHAYDQYQREMRQTAYTSPLSNAVLQMAGAKVYENALRTMGYSNNAARIQANRSQDTGAQLARQLGAMWVDRQAGDDIRLYATQSYEALRKFHNRNSPDYQRIAHSYAVAGREIFKGVSTGELGAYSLSEAYQMGAHLVSTGKYGTIKDDRQRVDAIKKDLKQYASGIADLKDALGGSLDDVLSQFESLAGSSVAVTSSSRFKSIARSLYQTTVYGRASQELIQSAVASQHALYQGTGATQATSVASGLFNANVLAHGVGVEGTNADEMGDLMQRQNRMWLTSGRRKELAAAYAYYADTHNLKMSQENFKKFLETELKGDASAKNVKAYLDKNDVTGTYINSERVRRTQSQPELDEALYKSEYYDKFKKDFEQEFNSGNENDTLHGLVQREDIALGFEGFRDTVYQRARQRKRKELIDAGTSEDEADKFANKHALDIANEAEERFRGLIRKIAPHAQSPEAAKAVLDNIGATLQDRTDYKVESAKQELAATTTITGMSGVFTKMIQHDNGVATIGKILSGAYGVTMNPEMEDRLKKIQQEKDPAKRQEAMQQFITDAAQSTAKDGKPVNLEDFATQGAENVSKMRSLSNLDKKLLSPIIDKNGKDISNDAGMEITKGVVHVASNKKLLAEAVAAKTRLMANNYAANAKGGYTRSSDLSKLRAGIEQAVELGQITEEEAFVYKQEALDQNWGARSKQDKSKIIGAFRMAKDLGYAEDDATKMANTVRKITMTNLGTKENKEARAQLVKSIQESDKFKDIYGKADEATQKRIAMHQAAGFLGDGQNKLNTESILMQILAGVSAIASK